MNTIVLELENAAANFSQRNESSIAILPNEGKMCRCQLSEYCEEGQISHEEGILHFLNSEEELQGRQRTLIAKNRERLLFGTRQAIFDRRELLQMTTQGRSKKRERGGVPRYDQLDVSWSRGCKSVPRSACQDEFSLRNRRASISERGKLLRRELTEANEVFHARVLTDADEAETGSAAM